MTVFSSSFTEIYYTLLDLPADKQETLLAKVKLNNPDLYSRLSASLNEIRSFNFTSMLGFHAEQLMDHADIMDLSGHLVDKYRLIKELGRGGMGVVFEAERADKTFEQKLAIKFIQPSLCEIVGTDFLYLEAQLLAKLNHPYIAKVFDGGRYNSLIYIAMEKVEGQTLNEAIKNQRLTTNEKLRLFVKIGEAIEHAHQNRILHADIKPENIIIDEKGDPKILDFNITQRMESIPAHTNASLLAFSKKFASPEQCAGNYLNNQSDVYSLGKLLDYLLPEARIDTDAHFIISKATEPQPHDRYSSVQAMIDDVQNILAYRPISIRQNQFLYVFKRLTQRKPFHTIAVLSLLCAISLFSGLLIEKNHQLNKEKTLAEKMMFEMTQLLFHGKGNVDQEKSMQAMLELTRRRILSNPDLPAEIKQKMLLAIIPPAPAPVEELKKSTDRP